MASLSATRASDRARICAASTAALTAPAAPTDTVATGTPGGICTVASSASHPSSGDESIGTPMTGRAECAATTPARCAAAPAPTMNTFTPADGASAMMRCTRAGERCAEATVMCDVTPSASSISTALRMTGASELDPISICTSLCICTSRSAVRRLSSVVQAPPRTSVAIRAFCPISVRTWLPSNADAPDGVVRTGDRLRIARAAGNDREHAAAAGDDTAVLQRRAGVGHVHARHRGGGVESLDRPAGLVRSGVPARGHHDADVRVRGDAPAGVAEVPARRPEQHRRETALDHRKNDLRLRIAEAHVELDHPRAGRRQHEADVEHPAVVAPLGAQTVERRVDDVAHHPRLELGAEERARSERTHAARVRPRVTVEDALVILDRGQGQATPAVGDDEEGDLGPRQALLDDDGRTGVPEAPGYHRLADGGFRGGPDPPPP